MICCSDSAQLISMTQFQLDSDVQALMKEGFTPCFHPKCHRDGLNILAPCCESAQAVLRSSIIAASSRSKDGLQGVLTYLSSQFSWGTKFELYLCDMMRCAHEIDCGAMTSIALMGLQMFLESEKSLHVKLSCTDLSLASVQVIMRDDPSNGAAMTRELKRVYGDQARYYSRWYRDHAVYHQCVGIFSESSGRLAVWDFGRWILCPDTVVNSQNAVVAIKVNPCKSTRKSFVWDGRFEVIAHQWTNVPLVTVHPTAFSVDPSMVRSYLCGSDGSHGVDTAIKTDDEGKRLPGKTVVVYVTGSHMSGSPNPATGVARALKDWMATARAKGDVSNLDIENLLVVGIDDSTADPLCGLTDRVFDGIRDTMLHGALVWTSSISSKTVLPLSADPSLSISLEEFWEAVVSMLLDPMQSLSSPLSQPPSTSTSPQRSLGDAETFFLPVSCQSDYLHALMSISCC